jgi:hypothetical protein
MIKKFKLTIFLLLAFSSFLCGQTTPTEVKTTQNSGNLQNFSPPEEEFSSESPVTFLPGFINIATATSTKSRLYKTASDNIYFYIFSDNLKTPLLNEVAFRFAGSAADRNKQNVIFKFTDSSGFHHRLLSLKTLNRVYTFQTVSQTEDDPLLDRFFAGIKINFKKPELKESVADIDRQNVDKPIKPENKSNVSSASVSGAGSGNGIATGNTNSGNIANNGQSSPIKILTKPRPNYTDFAKIYEMTGIIRLKVTFQANGEIGRIIPAVTLPFGLTEQAIEAAKQIKFEPAIVDGKLVTQVKTVEYSFSMF